MKSWSSHCGDSTKISEERLLLQINYKKNKTNNCSPDVLQLSNLKLASRIADHTDHSRASINSMMSLSHKMKTIERYKSAMNVIDLIINYS